MKSIHYFILLTSFTLSSLSLAAQDLKQEKIDIKTSAVCNMCVNHIKKALKKTEGVTKASINLETGFTTVTYNPEKTNPEKIRTAISMSGYDADDVKADPTAYNKLDECCKKDAKH